MNLRTKFLDWAGSFWRSGWMGIATTILVGLLLLLPIFTWFREVSYDLLFLFKPTVHPDEAVIVAMDEDSYHNLHQSVSGRWDRSLHARLLQNLSRAGAKAVAFDILFDEDGDRPDQDAAFSNSLKQAGSRVALAGLYDVQKSANYNSATIRLPADSLGTNYTAGIVNLPAGSFGMIDRLASPPPKLGENQYNTMAGAVDDLSIQAENFAPGERWINFYGPPGTIRSISYWLVVSNLTKESLFAHKYVFVGRAGLITGNGPNTGDFHTTPFTLMGYPKMRGVEIQATTFLNLHEGDWLESTSPFTNVLLSVIAGMVLGWLFSISRWRRKLRLAFAAVFCVLILALACFWLGKLWFPWLNIALIQVPVAVTMGRLAPRKARYAAFISYRRENGELALWVQSELKRAYFECYMDVLQLKPGAVWREELENAIIESACFILLLSESSLNECLDPKDVLRREIEMALANKNGKAKKFLTIKIGEFEIDEYWKELKGRLNHSDKSHQDLSTLLDLIKDKQIGLGYNRESPKVTIQELLKALEP